MNRANRISRAILNNKLGTAIQRGKEGEAVEILDQIDTSKPRWDINASSQRIFLYDAIIHGYLTLVQALLDKGSSTHIQYTNGETHTLLDYFIHHYEDLEHPDYKIDSFLRCLPILYQRGVVTITDVDVLNAIQSNIGKYSPELLKFLFDHHVSTLSNEMYTEQMEMARRALDAEIAEYERTIAKWSEESATNPSSATYLEKYTPYLTKLKATRHLVQTFPLQKALGPYLSGEVPPNPQAPITSLDPVLLPQITKFLGGKLRMRYRKPSHKRNKTKSHKERRNKRSTRRAK